MPEIQLIFKVERANLKAKQKEVVSVACNGQCKLVGSYILNIDIVGLTKSEITRKYRNIQFIFLVEVGTFYSN